MSGNNPLERNEELLSSLNSSKLTNGGMAEYERRSAKHPHIIFFIFRKAGFLRDHFAFSLCVLKSMHTKTNVDVHVQRYVIMKTVTLM